MISELAPHDDVIIPCEVRLWENRSVIVFVHPREWAKISLSGGTPLRVRCVGVEFGCLVMSAGEFYRLGSPKDISPGQFPVPGHGDYPAEAWIDWDEAIPDLVRDGIRSDPELLTRWRALSLNEARRVLNEVLRAQKPSSRAERSLRLLAALRDR